MKRLRPQFPGQSVFSYGVFLLLFLTASSLKAAEQAAPAAAPSEPTPVAAAVGHFWIAVEQFLNFAQYDQFRKGLEGLLPVGTQIVEKEMSHGQVRLWVETTASLDQIRKAIRSVQIAHAQVKLSEANENREPASLTVVIQ